MAGQVKAAMGVEALDVLLQGRGGSEDAYRCPADQRLTWRFTSAKKGT
jgi:hypothetical protein